MKKFIKLFYTILIIFVLLNISMVIPAFASNPSPGTTGTGAGNINFKTSPGATAGLFAVRFIQVAVTGFFVIKFTIIGIQYFISVATQEPQKTAEMKNKLLWNFVLAVLAFLSMFLLGFAFGI